MRNLIFIFLLIPSVVKADSPWKQEKNSLGIKVYTRSIDNSDIKEFKAITTIPTAKKNLVKILTDVDNFTDWFPDIVESEIVKQISDNVFQIYYAVDLPWPADDRDATLRMKVVHSTDNTKTTIYHKIITGVREPREGYIRIPKGNGFWNLTETDEGTRVCYQFHSEPGGSFPEWLINTFIVDSPFNTVMALRDKADKDFNK